MFNQRQQQIIELVQTEGEIRVNELKERFDVAEMTIRRDLEKLEQHGVLRRTFGGAIAMSRDIALRERAGVRTEEKAAIGKAAAALVRPGESVFIDGGTTTLEVARYLPSDSGITVVTNALNVASELLDKKIQTIVIGGILMEATSSLVGPLAIEALGRMAFDRVFLGTTGITAEHGCSNSNLYEADIKRLARTKSTETNIVADSSKFNQRGLVSFATLQEVTRIITDTGLEESLRLPYTEAGIDIMFALPHSP